jgi:transcriptional regulator with XRE-family HTH domain
MEPQEMDNIFLKHWRQYAGLTQTELGERMGITGTQISRIESGKRDFDGRFLMMFKEAINARLDGYKQEGETKLLRIFHMADPLHIKPNENDWVDYLTRLEGLQTVLVQWKETLRTGG